MPFLRWLRSRSQSQNDGEKTKPDSPPTAPQPAYRRIVESAHDWILQLAPDDRIVYANPSALIALGRPRDQVIGHPFGSFLEASHRTAWYRRLEHQVEKQVWESHGELAVHIASEIDSQSSTPSQPSTIWLAYSAHFHATSSNSGPFISVIARDITPERSKMIGLQKRQTRIDEELNMARAIHQSLLPARVPKVAGLDIGLIFVPAYSVGGDYVEFLREDDQHLSVFFADISGHGVAAALLSTMLKSVLASTFEEHPKDPAGAFAAINQRLHRDFPTGKFASAAFLDIDIRQRQLALVKAAQEPLLLHRPGEAVRVFEEGGPALGLLPPELIDQDDYTCQHIQLRPGDTLLLYTDGLTELSDAHTISREQLIQWFTDNIQLPAQDLASHLHQKAITTNGYFETPDDLAILVIRIG